jgi:hypothetical protein
VEHLNTLQSDRNLVEIRKLIEETNKYLEESRKYNEESRKLSFESRKLEIQTQLTSKKVHWFEATIMMAVVVATATVTKLFL